MDYTEWKREVETLCQEHFDCDCDDLPDMPYESLHDEDFTPEEMAIYMVHELDRII